MVVTDGLMVMSEKKKKVDLKKVKHGIPSTYNNYNCRCDICREAWAMYMRPRIRAYRKNKKMLDY